MKAFKLFSAILFFAALGFAQTNVWKPTNGPLGGYVSYVILHPFDDQKIIAFERYGIYRTTNGGRAWINVGGFQGIHPPLMYTRSNPPVLFGSGNAGLYRSFDDGITWSQVLPYFVSSLTSDPNNPSRILAGGDSGKVYQSTDGGATWRRRRIISQWSISAVGLITGDSLLMFAGTTGDFDFPGDGLFRSSDGGSTWTNRTFGYSNVTHVVVDQSSSMYVGTGGGGMYFGAGMYKSTNRGLTWDSINVGIPQHAMVKGMLINPANANHLIAAVSGYLGPGQLYVTKNGGASWSPANIGIADYTIEHLAATPSNPSAFFIGGGSGLLRGNFSSDPPTLLGVRPVAISSVAIHPTDSRTLYAIGSGTFKTTDGGDNWTLIDAGGQALAISISNPNVLYSGNYGLFGAVYKSTNAGLTWTTTALRDVAINDVAISPTNANVVFAGGLLDTRVGGLFRTTNGGVSWDTLRNGIGTAVVRSIAFDVLVPTTVYAGTMDRGVFKTTDGGQTWNAINNGLPTPAQFFGYVLDIAVDSHQPAIVYCAAYRAGMFKSTNGGASWDSINARLGTRDVRAIAVDPQNSQRLYVGNWDRGAFRSLNGGATWTEMNNGWDSVKVVSLALTSETNPVLYAGLAGGSYGIGGVWSYTFSTLSVEGGERKPPSVPVLNQNYPNPFNPSTFIAFTIPPSYANSNVELTIYDVQGQRVQTLVKNTMPAGNFVGRWDGRNEKGNEVASGVFFYRLKVGGFVKTKKLIVVR